MIRTIVNDRRVPHPVSGALSGFLFRKSQNGGDWSPLTPYKGPGDSGVEMIVAAIRQRTAEIRALKGQIPKATATERRKIMGKIVELKSRRSVLHTDLQAYRAIKNTRDANATAARIIQRQRRKEENHNYGMNLLSASYGVGDIFDANGNKIQSNASIVDRFGFVGFSTDQWDSNDDIALNNKLASKLQEHVDFHAAVTIAEIDRTRDMILDGARKLARSLKKASKRDFVGAARVLGNTKNTSASLGTTRRNASGSQKWIAQADPVRDKYLQYQLGIKPLVADAQAAVRALAWYLNRPTYQKIMVRRKKDPTKVVVDSAAGYYASRREQSGQLIAILKHQPRAADILGFTDIASGLWERVPLSFVVDWWIPIGGWLESLNSARTFGDVFTVKTVVTRTHQSVESSRQKGLTFQANLPTFEYRVNVSRVCGVGLTTDLPTFKPLFHKDKDVRTRHTLESIALAHKYAQIVDNNRVKDIAERDRGLKQLAVVNKLKSFPKRWSVR